MPPQTKSIDDIIRASDLSELLSKSPKDEHALSDFLKDVDDKSRKLAITKLFDQLIGDGVIPTVEPLRDRSTWHTPYPIDFDNPEMPEYVKRIQERYNERGEFEEGKKAVEGQMRALKNRLRSEYSEDLLGRKDIHGKEIPRGDYHDYQLDRIPGSVQGEPLWTDESLRKFQSGTGSPKIHVEPGSIKTLIAELAHYVQYKDMTGEELAAAKARRAEDIKKHGSPTLSRNIYGAEDTYEWEAHSMIQPQIQHMFDNLLREYRKTTSKVHK
jgi:hypothetical protein